MMASLVSSTALAAVLLTPATTAHRFPEVPRLRIGAAALTLAPSAAPAPLIAARRKGDSLRNGAIWGAVLGGVYGAVSFGRFADGAGSKLAFVAGFTATGALIGTCIDAMHSRKDDPVRRVPFGAKRSIGFRARF